MIVCRPPEGAPPVRFGRWSLEDYCDIVRNFHGSVAPGMLIGSFMVQHARAVLPPDILFEAICETRVCVADAVQLLTPCTTGNGRLRVINVGRYALALYDKFTGKGVRVHLDAGKLDDWPETRSWFLKLTPKAEQDTERLLGEIIAAGNTTIGRREITVDPSFLGKRKLGPVHFCRGCGESIPVAEGELCGGCRGGVLPYR
ncbi:MAG: formylmethanofuran dehydrogenase subunit E family protein [Deltaproteobacteria bacterium]|nr:formylmethanofuran dehydrogenase subunit E family protein [Candidatus Anaeroferrophillacea bacterium]